MLVSEVRNTENKKVHFVAIDIENGKELWKKNIHDTWWVGIETIHKNKIIFHGYATPELPEHLHLIVVDSFNGTINWKSDELKYLLCKENEIICIRQSNLGYEILGCDIETGAVLNRYDEETIRNLCNLTFTDLQDTVRYPESIDLNKNPEIDKSTGVLPKFIIVEYLMLDDHVVIAGYEQNKNKLTYELIILKRKNMKPVYRDIIISNSKSVMNGTFIKYSGIVIYPVENRFIKAVKI
ncbi:MAG: DUF4905 domain-containing protein [Ignavibacteriales bacterium]|nr:DUF4905 domain-containing protein [Ignavibacteriales bacterium]